jgi:hypothetical protein
MKTKKSTAVVMSIAILQMLLNNGSFRKFPPNSFFPNDVGEAEHDDQKIGIVVTFPSTQGEFSLNKSANDRALNGLRSDKLDQAFVVQARRQGGHYEVLASINVEELQSLLDMLNIWNGDYGQYWWVPPGFKLENVIPASDVSW